MEKKRLIYADSLMDVIRQHEYRLATKQGSIDYGMFTLGIQQAVDEQPTIDAVHVVRCRECKWWREDDDVWHCDNPDGLDNYAKPDDFCSYGERKEGVD